MNFFYVKKQRYTSAGDAPAMTYHSREHTDTTVRASAVSQQTSLSTVKQQNRSVNK